jgi:hypothetical protein
MQHLDLPVTMCFCIGKGNVKAEVMLGERRAWTNGLDGSAAGWVVLKLTNECSEPITKVEFKVWLT